ncbi:MAG: hypothetical protein Q7S40_10005 [Opitutaceae bacterium]|nr:hypothetical protein [Opitutaceae bacterium]
MQTSTFRIPGEPVSRLSFGAFGLAGVFGAFSQAEAIEAMHGCCAVSS